MSPGSLGNRLKREIKANPKKAVILGVVTLVAVYFWVPLVLGWANKNKSRVAATPVVTANASTAPVASPIPNGSTGGNETSAAVRPSWAQVAQWKQNDPRTKTADPLATDRDPFSPVKTETISPEEVAAKAASAKPAVLSPAQAGLVLTSTVVGPERRVAQINGKSYSVGQTIQVIKDSKSLGISFTLVDVQPRSVVLESDGRQFDLAIPQPGQSDKIELMGTP